MRHGWKDPSKMSLHELRAEVRYTRGVLEISEGLKCPDCADVGFTVEAKSTTEYDCDPHDPDGEPVPIETHELVQIQCEFCYTVEESVFNRRLRATKEVAT